MNGGIILRNLELIMDYKEIKLTHGKVTLVSIEDYECLSQWKWHLAGRNYEYVYRSTHIGSAKNGTRKQIHISMHRQIMNAPKDLQVDHINGNKLDNRRSNLRLCNNSQNHQNIGLTKKNTSGFKGVRLDKRKWRNKRWLAEIKTKEKSLFLGYFETKEEAATAYNQAAKKHHGEFARLNDA